MRRLTLYISILVLARIWCGASDSPKTPAPAMASVHAGAASSLALSPGVLEVRTQPGVSSSHVLSMSNLTGSRLGFVLEAFDVAVRDGKGVVIRAGETQGGIARSAVFSPATIELDPGETGQVRVTLTVPADPKVRAVAAIFRGQTAVRGGGGVMMVGSLGTLITYNLSAQVKVRAGAPTITRQTEKTNLVMSEQLENDGQEPAIPKGTLAILKSSGELIGRVAIPAHRLLPGEKFNCEVEYPHSLRPGKYRAMMSIQQEGGVQSSGLEFEVE